MKFRAFVGLSLDESCVTKLARAAGSLQQFDKKAEVRWVDPENYHLTLAFLGDILDSDADRLMTALQAEVAAQKPFVVELSQVGYFPLGDRPRMVLAFCAGSDALSHLHRAVLRAVRRVGLRVEKHRFMPHVTLGRVRSRRTPWLDISPQPLCASTEVGELHLFRSDLDPKGARYRVVHTAGWSGDSW